MPSPLSCSAGAQFNLGINYKQGIGVEPSLAEATAWFEKAADQGHGDAAFICAQHYGKGQGVAKDMGMEPTSALAS